MKTIKSKEIGRPKVFITLLDEEIKELKKLYKTVTEFEKKKINCILSNAKKIDRITLSIMFDVTERTIVNWLTDWKLYKIESIIWKPKNRDKYRKIFSQQEEFILKLTSDGKTSREIQEEFKNKFDLTISKWTILFYIKKNSTTKKSSK